MALSTSDDGTDSTLKAVVALLDDSGGVRSSALSNKGPSRRLVGAVSLVEGQLEAA